MTDKNDSVKAVSNDVLDKKTTKEKIFDVAIDLFAQKGFDAVSLREISDAVGIKKPTLYHYFKSKDEILEKILEYPMKRVEEVGWHDTETEELIVSLGLEKFMSKACDICISWMDDPYMEKIFRIILVELYHNQQIKNFYSMFIDVSSSFWELIFTLMIKHNLIKPLEPKILAREYLSFYGNAFFQYYLLQYGNISGSFRQEYQDVIDQHTAFMVNAIRP